MFDPIFLRPANDPCGTKYSVLSDINRNPAGICGRSEPHGANSVTCSRPSVHVAGRGAFSFYSSLWSAAPRAPLKLPGVRRTSAG